MNTLPTDSDLLAAYLARTPASEPAFRTLAERYTPLVYAAARRQAPPHLAEDTTQAVFLLLARRAHTLHNPALLPAWLLSTTRFCALAARRTEQRRLHHEQKAAAMAPTQSLPPADPADIAPHLDAVLLSLSPTDRAALLLRYYDDQPIAQVAATLHLSEDAAKKRLSRPLQKLRHRFSKKHLPLAAPVLAALLAKNALATPPALAAACITAAATPTAPILVLTKGATTLMLHAKLKLAATFAAATLLLATTTTLLHHQTTFASAPPLPPTPAASGGAGPAPTSAPTPTPDPTDPTPDPITVRGTIFDPAGHPLPNATITIPSFTTYTAANSRPVVTTHSGPDGRYQLSFHKADVSAFSDGAGSPATDRWKQTLIVASAPNFALAWAQWDHTDPAGNLDLHLPPDENPIDATLLDPAGKPAANTTVSVENIHDFTDKQFEDAYAKGPAAFRALPPGLQLPLGALGLPNPLTTDANGHFHLAGLGPNRWLTLRLHGPSAGLATIEVVTQPVPPHTRAYRISGTARVPTVAVLGNHFTYTARPAFSLEGTLRDAVTHAPIPNATLKGQNLIEDHSVSLSFLRTTSDANGHYRFDGIPTGGKRSFIIFPNQPAPYLPREITCDDAPPGSTQTLDADLHQGRWITGTVTDKRTGRPLCARIRYTTYLDNPHTAVLPEFKHFDAGEGGVLDGDQSQYETQPDGSFRIVAVPGPAIIGVECWGSDAYPNGIGADQIPAYQNPHRDPAFSLYQSYPFPEFAKELRQIDVPEALPIPTVNFQLGAGRIVHATIVDATGKLVPGCIVEHSKIAGHAGDVIGPLPGSTFDITNLADNESRTLLVINLDKKIAALYDFTPDDIRKGQITIPLQPCAELTGKCLKPDGSPAPNVVINVECAPGETAGQCTTDANGNFQCTVIPGAETYAASVDRGPYFLSTIAEKFSLDPGESHDLGTITLHPHNP